MVAVGGVVEVAGQPLVIDVAAGVDQGQLSFLAGSTANITILASVAFFAGGENFSGYTR